MYAVIVSEDLGIPDPDYLGVFVRLRDAEDYAEDIAMDYRYGVEIINLDEDF